MLHKEATSCPILGIQYFQTASETSDKIGKSGFASAIIGNIKIFKLAITIEAKIIAAPLFPLPPYICPKPGISNDKTPAITGFLFI